MKIQSSMAVILCCYNRKMYTDRCISQIQRMGIGREWLELDFFVCDDNSTDGTVELLEKKYPFINLIKTSGDFYWCKSMYIAMKKATEKKYDFYLMVNDDVDFFSDALDIMLNTYKSQNEICGVVGSTKWEENITYGGWRENQLVIPNGQIQECEWTNWNCFLVPHRVVEQVGIIDNKYQHSYGDFDYAYRMRKCRIPLYVAPEFVGCCKQNSACNTFRDVNISRIKRLQSLFSSKGLPIYSYFRYHIRVYGKKNILLYIFGYLSLIGYIILKKPLE